MRADDSAAKPDVIVVGAGVMGLSLAWRLARENIRVLLLESSTYGMEASGIPFAALWPPPADRLSPAHRFHLESLRSYPDFLTLVVEDSSLPIEYRRLGRIELLTHPAKQAQANREVVSAQGQRHDDLPATRIVEAAEVARLEPCLAPVDVPALVCMISAYVSGRALCRSLETACSARGGILRQRVRVTDLLLERDRCLGVMTTEGPLHSAWVVVTAGAWTSAILDQARVADRIVPAKGQVLLVRPSPAITLERLVKSSRTYLIPTRRGEVLIGSTSEPEAGYDKNPTEIAKEELLSRAELLVPGLGKGTIIEHWTGLRPQPERRRALVGAVPGIKGLAVASGHYKVGVALAPAVSEWMARMILGDAEARERLAPFAPTSPQEH